MDKAKDNFQENQFKINRRLTGGLFFLSGMVISVLCISLSQLVTNQSSQYPNVVEGSKSSKCSDPMLKGLHDAPVAGLLKDNKSQKKYELSDVIQVNNSFYAICDSSWSIIKIDEQIPVLSDQNQQIGDPKRFSDESLFEAIIYDKEEEFFVIREAVKYGEKEYRPEFYQVQIVGDDYEIIEKCTSDMIFDSDSKGFEGAIGIKGTDGEFYIFGLCEGNYCKQKSDGGSSPGHGRIIVMKREYENQHQNCSWNQVATVKLPKYVAFKDYSSISRLDGSSSIAITSQEDSKVWIGEISSIEDNLLDVSQDITFTEGKIYNFPTNSDCSVVYCNIEGIAWIDEKRFVSVSDKKKSNQDLRCFHKDQSFHLFSLV